MPPSLAAKDDLVIEPMKTAVGEGTTEGANVAAVIEPAAVVHDGAMAELTVTATAEVSANASASDATVSAAIDGIIEGTASASLESPAADTGAAASLPPTPPAALEANGDAEGTCEPPSAGATVPSPAAASNGLGSSDPGPLLVISDPHGNLTVLKRALKRGAELAGREDLTVVLLGDYCDNGPEIRELLDFLADVAESGGRYGEMTLRPIIGNHDFICLLALVPGIFGSTGNANGSWERWHNFWNGWKAGTPHSYGSHDSVTSFRARFPTRHRRLLEGLPWYERIDSYVFVHAGLSMRTPVEEQLRFLDAKDLSQLHSSGYTAWKAGATGMPDQITNKDWAQSNSPSWGCIVVTGHNKYSSGSDYLASHRLGLHSCACERIFDADLPLHCALLKRGARDLTRSADAPRQFKVR
mmetsp:Transcript_171093/g.415896  ORF Transcript_171093/g.415896 Transcript_171093/m.415896 type:complete len:414 (-) Transcript_171093:12-1253(-)